MIRDINQKWRLLSGEGKWNKLLDPLDIDLRRYLIHYGERAEATYDTFNKEVSSRFAGSSLYARKDLFSRVGLEICNPYKYEVTKYFYATSGIALPEAFLLKPKMKDSWLHESNFFGYVAVTTDEGKAALGRRDILIAWRGVLQGLEWINETEVPLVPATKLFGDGANIPQVHMGFLSLYTSDNPRSEFNKYSAREQILQEVTGLLDKFKNEEVSITVSGHSLGAALGQITAVDIAAQLRLNKLYEKCPVTAFLFACPRAGDFNFKKLAASLKGLHILRVSNVVDIVPLVPFLDGYTVVGEELSIDTTKSYFLINTASFIYCHDLEAYLHGIAGTQGRNGGFNLEVHRDISLVNKFWPILKDEYHVPTAWWVEKNKGMDQENNGSWMLNDHEKDDDDP